MISYMSKHCKVRRKQKIEPQRKGRNTRQKEVEHKVQGWRSCYLKLSSNTDETIRSGKLFCGEQFTRKEGYGLLWGTIHEENKGLFPFHQRCLNEEQNSQENKALCVGHTGSLASGFEGISLTSMTSCI